MIISIVMITGILGQTTDTLKKTRYGIELSQFITGSGFASGTEVYVTVIPDQKKNLSLGLYFCPEAKKITGFSLHHEMSLLRRSGEKSVAPYAFYNMIYRITKTRELMSDINPEAGYGTYKSIEHHLGVGVRITLAKDLYLKSAVGYGVYLGSIKKPSEANPVTGEVMGKNGFGAIAKIGIAFVI